MADLRGWLPPARFTFVGPGDEGERGAEEDLQVDPGRAVLDVPDVELDAFVPRQLRAAVYLGPAGEAGLDVEPAALPGRVLLHLVAKRGPRADEAHVAADDVPELRQLVEREAAEEAARPGDAGVAAVDGEAGALALGADDHRPQLEQVEVSALVADAALAVEDRAAVLELDRDRCGREHRAGEREPERRPHDVGRAVHRPGLPGHAPAARRAIDPVPGTCQAPECAPRLTQWPPGCAG